MDVTSTSSTASAIASATPPPMPTINSDYQTFLTMMTTQLQNQDPMDPMSSDQFAVQLATFSGVEEQVQTNDLLTQMLAATTQQSMSQMAGWVGNEARIAAPVYFGGDPVTLSPNPAEAADKATLVVTDANGVEVARKDIPVSTANYEWQGTDNAGNPLPDGIYNLSLESYTGDQLLGSTSVEYYAGIEEVRSSPAGVTILVDGDIEVPAIYVTALRPPPPPAVATAPAPDPTAEQTAALQ